MPLSAWPARARRGQVSWVESLAVGSPNFFYHNQAIFIANYIHFNANAIQSSTKKVLTKISQAELA